MTSGEAPEDTVTIQPYLAKSNSTYLVDVTVVFT